MNQNKKSKKFDKVKEGLIKCIITSLAKESFLSHITHDEF